MGHVAYLGPLDCPIMPRRKPDAPPEMRRKTEKLPRKDRAYVWLDGQRHYLGQWGAKASQREYQRLLARWLDNGGSLPPPPKLIEQFKVRELVSAYWAHCKTYYVKDGKPTDEAIGSISPPRDGLAHRLAKVGACASFSAMVCVCASLFCAVILLSPTAGFAAELPNIVIIYADDMGYGDLAIQNSDSKIPTPNLDQLAREGVRFTDGHSSSGICTPSRYALLTGRYHWRKFHNIVGSWGPGVFSKERLTLPEMLQAKGYRTACIGKWHLGFDWEAIRRPDAKRVGEGKKKNWPADAFDWSKPIPDGPLDHGFDEYFGDDVPNFPPYTWIENDRVVQPPTVPYQPDPVPSEGAAEGRAGPMVAGWKQDAVMPTLTQRAVEWIAQQKEQDGPFFLYWSWTSPHAPIVPTDAWQGKTKAGGYGDFMAQSDAYAGEVLKALDEHEFRDTTIVIFSSDNGPERYAFERVRAHNHVSSGPLRGVKRDIFEGGHRVPFMVRWPREIQPGSISDGLISQIDIMATLAGVVGYELPNGAAEDSHDQIELWKGGSSLRHSMVHNTYKHSFAFRQGDWVFVDAKSGSAKNVPSWYAAREGYTENPHPGALYKLSDDPGQRTNRYALQPERVEQMRQRLAEVKQSGEVRQ